MLLNWSNCLDYKIVTRSFGSFSYFQFFSYCENEEAGCSQKEVVGGCLELQEILNIESSTFTSPVFSFQESKELTAARRVRGRRNCQRVSGTV